MPSICSAETIDFTKGEDFKHIVIVISLILTGLSLYSLYLFSGTGIYNGARPYFNSGGLLQGLSTQRGQSLLHPFSLLAFVYCGRVVWQAIQSPFVAVFHCGVTMLLWQAMLLQLKLLLSQLPALRAACA